jgi:hypothetical protein
MLFKCGCLVSLSLSPWRDDFLLVFCVNALFAKLVVKQGRKAMGLTLCEIARLRKRDYALISTKLLYMFRLGCAQGGCECL